MLLVDVTSLRENRARYDPSAESSTQMNARLRLSGTHQRFPLYRSHNCTLFNTEREREKISLVHSASIGL